MSVSVRLEYGRLDPDLELKAFIETAGGAGAVASFVGLVRRGEDDSAVQALVLEHHPTLTDESMREIAEAALQRFEVEHVLVVHRCGMLIPGEAIVFVAAASAHRRAAFETVDYLMDRLKTEAAFWKREEGEFGRRWIEPTDADYEARKRWDS